MIVEILMSCFLGGEGSDREMFVGREAAIFQMDEGFLHKRVKTNGESCSALTGE